MLRKDTSNMLFLLGGHDLEMLEIRQLLNQQGFQYVDRSLSWDSARLSAYDDVIEASPNLHFIGIELMEDCRKPVHYIRIDHHNDFNGSPATILQVAQLIGLKPTRHLLLVAANDSGYIPAMLEMGASDEEVKEIRRKDRAAQGVTVDDEQAAERSITEGLTRVGETLIVYSQTSRFSPICDRLYPYRRLLIYTDTEWMFYGDGKAELVTLLTEDIVRQKIYHGGGDSGYIGTVREAYDKQQIVDFVKYIHQKYGAL